MTNRKSSVPSEISDFFRAAGGKSILVKGGAGTGKTTFALQLLEEIGDPDKSFYLSTRVSDEALYSQFPWLKDKEMRSRIIDSSRVLLDTLFAPGEGEDDIEIYSDDLERISTARDFLKSLNEDVIGPPTKVDRTRLSVMLERNRMPEIERIYDRVEQNLPERSMLVVDSVEGVTHKYSLDPEEFVTMIQKVLMAN